MGLKFSRKSREALQDQGLVRRVSAAAGAEIGMRKALAAADESDAVRDSFMGEVQEGCPGWRIDLAGTDFDMGSDCYLYSYVASCGKGDEVRFTVYSEEGSPAAFIDGIDGKTFSAPDLVKYLRSMEKSSAGEVATAVTAGCEEGELSRIYGDGDAYYADGSSATGFYATKLDIIGFSVLHNDCDMLRTLHDERIACPESKLNSTDRLCNFNYRWECEDLKPDDPEMVFSWKDQFEHEFVKDWERIVGREDNEEALKLLLEYEPELTLCEVDFWNAFHKGYSKQLLSRLAANMVSASGKEGFESVYNCDYDSLSAFLSSGSSATASAREATASGNAWNKVVNGFELVDYDDPDRDQFKEFGNEYLASIGRDDLQFYPINDDSLRKALHWKNTGDLREMAEYFTERARVDSDFDPCADYFYMDGIDMVTFMGYDFNVKGPFADVKTSCGFKEWLILRGEIKPPSDT